MEQMVRLDIQIRLTRSSAVTFFPIDFANKFGDPNVFCI